MTETRCRQNFVEIVHVENDVALGRRETTEVEQMAIAASLNMQARRRSRG